MFFISYIHVPTSHIITRQDVGGLLHRHNFFFYVVGKYDPVFSSAPPAK